MMIDAKALGLLLEELSYEEMNTLCFELGISLDELYLRGKGELSRLLPARMQRRGSFAELVSVSHRLRPDLTLPCARRIGSWG